MLGEGTQDEKAFLALGGKSMDKPFIRLHMVDNVVIALADLPAGTKALTSCRVKTEVPVVNRVLIESPQRI